MKVRQFLNKLLYASSSIHRIFVVRGVEEKTQLVGVAQRTRRMKGSSTRRSFLSASLGKS